MTRGTLATWLQRGWLTARQRDEPLRRWVVWADSAELARLRGLRHRSVADEARRRWTQPSGGPPPHTIPSSKE